MEIVAQQKDDGQWVKITAPVRAPVRAAPDGKAMIGMQAVRFYRQRGRMPFQLAGVCPQPVGRELVTGDFGTAALVAGRSRA